MNPPASGPAAPLRFLSAVEVDRCLPDVERRLDLAAAALRSLARGEAEMPPKIGVHPRPGALLHAMPAWLRTGDLVGLKWIAAFPANKHHGLPAINGLVVLNDAETGLPTWIMDAARITAVRTAAVSGVAIRLFAPRAVRHVALLGAGTQARSHLEVVAALLPDAEVTVMDRHPERAQALADAANQHSGRVSVSASDDARGSVSQAELVISVATLGSTSQLMTSDWLRAGAVVIAVDFATYASAELAAQTAVFAVDDREQFLYYRDNGYFEGYPEPTITLGEVDTPSPPDRRPTLITHLGVGLADVMFADAIRQEAERRGSALALPR